MCVCVREREREKGGEWESGEGGREGGREERGRRERERERERGYTTCQTTLPQEGGDSPIIPDNHPLGQQINKSSVISGCCHGDRTDTQTFACTKGHDDDHTQKALERRPNQLAYHPHGVSMPNKTIVSVVMAMTTVLSGQT